MGTATPQGVFGEPKKALGAKGAVRGDRRILTP